MLLPLAMGHLVPETVCTVLYHLNGEVPKVCVRREIPGVCHCIWELLSPGKDGEPVLCAPERSGISYSHNRKPHCVSVAEGKGIHGGCAGERA